MASVNKPPGFPLKSSMIEVAPCAFRSSTAALVSEDAFLLNLERTTYPIDASIKV